jgi:hypothetical protein
VAHGCEVVNLVRVRPPHYLYDRGHVQQVTVPRVYRKVPNPAVLVLGYGVPPHHAVYVVSLLQEKLRQVASVLTGASYYQCPLLTQLNTLCLLRSV